MANRAFNQAIETEFPIEILLGDNDNAIIIQIWASMLANLLLTILKIKKPWVFSNMVTIIKYQLCYNKVYTFCSTRKSMERANNKKQIEHQNSLFQIGKGLTF